MKIIYIDISVYGHHIAYLKKLIEGQSEAKLILPTKIDSIDSSRQYIVPYDDKNKKFSIYLKWIRSVNKILKDEKPDLVHFLYGDMFYRFFGYGISKKYRTVITFHLVRDSFLRRLSIRRIFNRISCGVVHTKFLYDSVKQTGIENIEHIEYPVFSVLNGVSREESRKIFGINTNNKVIGALGSVREDKGLDILADALRGVKAPFHLFVAGYADKNIREKIEQASESYREHTTFLFDYLSDEGYLHAVNACDIIVLPYRKEFNGASGPMTDGVYAGKIIVGPEHGSLGQIIRTFHLGYTFESENIPSLTHAVNECLLGDYPLDDVATEYRKSLGVDFFKAKYLRLYDRLMLL